ncbi:MAG: rubrerythrin-like domain-containing protein [Halobellus sp.]|uniref:rubrerythrin-like domain-containing protein n=1 Tax=Halobellus sp. TaxID=1979212 RepID=UPI0035D4123E
MVDLGSETRTAMSSEVTTVDPACTVREAADTLRSEGIGSVVVEDQPPGIVTKTDLVEGIRQGVDVEETPISELMTTRPVAIDGTEPIRKAVEAMNEHSVKRLPVTADGRIDGIITTTDLVEALAGELDREVETVVGVFTELFGTQEDSIYECYGCGSRLSANDHPGSCPNCGNKVRNISVTQE